MGGIRRSFPLSPGEPPDAPEPSGVVAGAPFEIAASIGADWRGAPRRPASIRQRVGFEQAVRSESGLLFWLSGHQYRLRAATPKVQQSPRDSTDISIPPREVMALLDRGARQNADDPALAALLDRAKTELGASRSGQPPPLLLFETRPKLLVSPPLIVKPPEPPRKAGVAVEDLTFIEIQLVDEDGQPVSGMRYRLEMPDSTVRSGTIPKSGFLSFYKLEEPGLCHLKLMSAEQAADAATSPEDKPRAKAAAKPTEAETPAEATAASVDEPDSADENAAPEEDEPPVFIPDASPPATAPDKKLDFYDWPKWLIKAQRSDANKLKANLFGAEPTVDHLADFTAEVDSGDPMTAPRAFTADELQKITSNRASAATQAGANKLKPSSGRTDKKGNRLTGWMYPGRHPEQDKLVPAQINPAAVPNTKEWAYNLIWFELNNNTEGGYASFNTWDAAKLTWGQGWALTGFEDGLQGLLRRLWARAPELARAFLEHGISYDPATSTFSVVNVVDGQAVMETGENAVELLVASRDLLGVFISLGESSANTGQEPLVTDGPPFRQALVDAEYDQIVNSSLGRGLPTEVYQNCEERIVMFMAHMGHLRNTDMWKYPSERTIEGLLLAWARRSWSQIGSTGARTLMKEQLLINLRTWAKGIAAPLVAGGADGSFTEAMLSDPQYADLLAIWDPGQNGYHFYPHLPGGKAADEELYKWATANAADSIKALVAEAEKLGGQAKSFRASYDQSTRTTGAYGYRPRVALDAAIAKKAGAASHKKVYDDEHYQKLPLDQQEDIRAYLGDKKKGPWDYWDAKDYANFFLVTRPYSMDALLSTYGARGKATADQVRQKYDELGKPWGLRQWIALMTAYNKGGGENAGWILGHPGYKALYHDQRASIRRALGLPSATDVLAAETGCVDSAA